MTETQAPPETVLPVPLACWHESLLSARTDALVALACDSAIIATTRPLPVGTRVFLEVSLGRASNAARGEIDAVVVEGSLPGHPGFRVRFVELDEALRTWIAHTLEPPEPLVRSEIPQAPRVPVAVLDPLSVDLAPHAPTVKTDASWQSPPAHAFTDEIARLHDVSPTEKLEQTLPPPLRERAPAFVDLESLTAAQPAVVVDQAAPFDPFADILTPAPVVPEQPLVVHAPVEHAPVEHAPVVHAPVEHAPVAHAPVEHAPIAHAPVEVRAVDDVVDHGRAPSDVVPADFETNAAATLEAHAVDESRRLAPLVDAVASDVDDDEPLSISPAEPIAASPLGEEVVHDFARLIDDAFEISPFDETPRAHSFSPPLPVALAPLPSPLFDTEAPLPPTASRPQATVEDAFDAMSNSLDATFGNADETLDGAPDASSAMAERSTTSSSDDDEAAIAGAFASGLGELDPFDAFDAFNLARSRGTPAHGFAPVAAARASPADATPDAGIAEDASSPPAVSATMRAVALHADDDDSVSDAFAPTGAGPLPMTSSSSHVTTLRFDGRPVREELADGALAAAQAAVARFPTTQTDPQFGVVMPPRTDPMFPAVAGADDELRAALTRLGTDVSAGLSFSRPSATTEPLGLPVDEETLAPTIDDVRAALFGTFDTVDDIVEVSSTSELVEVTRGPDGAITALDTRGTGARTDEDTPHADAFDLDFDDSPPELDHRQGRAPAALDDADDLPLVVGSHAAPPQNPFVADPGDFTRKR